MTDGHTHTHRTDSITSTADGGGNVNPRKTQKAEITRKLAFWATKVALKAIFLGVEKMGLITSLKPTMTNNGDMKSQITLFYLARVRNV